ncbi:oligopeptide ABC transporter ATP-binding protein OppF [Rhodobacteraceae bacterium WD3A24]|nr:oligopeptide ABC transporter ATP-binding protein OppF [Rhodobacteraceae bacterium WD3A24]
MSGAVTGSGEALLRVEGLKVHFPIRGGVFGRPKRWVHAVDDVSLSIRTGETVALVGESGCGKTTTGQAVLGMTTPSAGRVLFDGVDVHAAQGDERRMIRRDIQIIFQDPFASLNPNMKVGESIAEPLLIHTDMSAAARRTEAESLLERVGLRASHYDRLPDQFSGGQRQRIVIARALALRPRLIVCDEPVSALDVSVRSQIMNLLMELQAEFGLAYLFISHDLSVVRHLSDSVAVMYLGHIVEEGPSEAVFFNPTHPYTEALLSAIPYPDPAYQATRRRIVLSGDLPDPSDPPAGCPFVSRCPIARGDCAAGPPALEPVAGAEPAHTVACFYRGKGGAAPAG